MLIRSGSQNTTKKFFGRYLTKINTGLPSLNLRGRHKVEDVARLLHRNIAACHGKS